MVKQQSHKFVLLAGLLILLPFFFYGGPAYHSPRSYMAIWNLGHILFFMLFVCYLKMRADEFTWLWALKVCCLVVGLGILIEIIQSGIDGRTASSLDVVRDFMGAVLGTVWVSWKRLSWQGKGGAAIIVGAIMIWNLYPVSIALVDEWQAREDFPLLAGFENSYELSRWGGDATMQRSQEQVRQGKFSLRLSLTTAIYSGIHFEHFPRDWRGFDSLRFSLYNDDILPLSVTVRVHDRKHEQGQQRYTDRFNRTFVLKHGWNDLKINLSDIQNSPKNRKMDLSEIRGLGIFVIRQSEKKVLYLDDVRLVN